MPGVLSVLHGAPEMSKATARRDLREALRFAHGCADRKGPVTGPGLAPWASDSRFRLVFPALTGLVPDLSTAYSCVHRPTWTHLSLRGPFSYSNKPSLRVLDLKERMEDSPEARISLEA